MPKNTEPQSLLLSGYRVYCYGNTVMVFSSTRTTTAQDTGWEIMGEYEVRAKGSSLWVRFDLNGRLPDSCQTSFSQVSSTANIVTIRLDYSQVRTGTFGFEGGQLYYDPETQCLFIYR